MLSLGQITLMNFRQIGHEVARLLNVIDETALNLCCLDVSQYGLLGWDFSNGV